MIGVTNDATVNTIRTIPCTTVRVGCAIDRSPLELDRPVSYSTR
jgi:hypothetical protein